MRLAIRTDTPPRGNVTPWFQVFTEKPWIDDRETAAVKAVGGFRWDGTRVPDHPQYPDNPGFPTKSWWTTDPDAAIKFLSHGDAECQAYLAARAAEIERALLESHAHDTTFPIPVPDGCVPRAYQRAGTAYAVRNFTTPLTPVEYGMPRTKATDLEKRMPPFAMPYRGVLFGDDPGLGKTVQALCTINAVPDIRRVLVVAPANAVMVWIDHAKQWLVRDTRVERVGAGTGWPALDKRALSYDQLVVINYEMVKKHRDAIMADGPWDLLIVDEAHMIRNQKAARTQHVLQIPALRRAYCTGTPVPKQVLNLWVLLSSLDPWAWHPQRDFMKFARAFANAHRTDIIGYDNDGKPLYSGQPRWDFSGSKDLDILQEKIRASVMVRRLKQDVLTELPPKVRTIVEMDPTGTDAKFLADQDRKLAPFEHQYHQVLNRGGIDREAFHEIVAIRQETALRMVPYAIDHIADALEDEKIIVFAWHRSVIDKIVAAFPIGTVVTITGQTPPDKRGAIARKFQEDPKVRLFVGNILAAGTAITLTASSRVVFIEEDFIPGNVTQAEDRAHRFGQRDSVLVEHLVFRGSIMVRMIGICIERQRVADLALDIPPSVSPNGGHVPPAHSEMPDATADGGTAIGGGSATDGTSSEAAEDRAPNQGASSDLRRPRPSFQAPPMGEPGDLALGRLFLLGGHAFFTVSSDDGAWRFTYRVSSPRPYNVRTTPNPGQKYFVGVLAGPENTRNYRYAGMLDPDTLTIRATRKSAIDLNAPSIGILRWLLQHLVEGRQLPPGYRFWHAGKCGRCGRLLTTPDSIAIGIGPVCLGL